MVRGNAAVESIRNVKPFGMNEVSAFVEVLSRLVEFKAIRFEQRLFLKCFVSSIAKMMLAVPAQMIAAAMGVHVLGVFGRQRSWDSSF